MPSRASAAITPARSLPRGSRTGKKPCACCPPPSFAACTVKRGSSASRYARTTAARAALTCANVASLARAIVASTSGSLAFNPASVAVRGAAKPKLAAARNRSIVWASAQWISPPSATANGLVACIEKTIGNDDPAPKLTPSSLVVPSEAAASTTTATPCRAAIQRYRSRSIARPNVAYGTIAATSRP